MAGKNTPGMSDCTRSAQHVKLVADFRQRSDNFEKSGVFEASIIWPALTAFILPTTDPHAEHACACPSFSRLYALIDGTLPTCFCPLILKTPIELITHGIGYTRAVDVHRCYRSFSQIPRDRTSYRRVTIVQDVWWSCMRHDPTLLNMDSKLNTWIYLG